MSHQEDQTTALTFCPETTEYASPTRSHLWTAYNSRCCNVVTVATAASPLQKKFFGLGRSNSSRHREVHQLGCDHSATCSLWTSSCSSGTCVRPCYISAVEEHIRHVLQTGMTCICLCRCSLRRRTALTCCTCSSICMYFRMHGYDSCS